jgi:hypothetical protein
MSQNTVTIVVLQVLRSSEDAIPRVPQIVVEVLRKRSTPVASEKKVVTFVVSS